MSAVSRVVVLGVIAVAWLGCGPNGRGATVTVTFEQNARSRCAVVEFGDPPLVSPAIPRDGNEPYLVAVVRTPSLKGKVVARAIGYADVACTSPSGEVSAPATLDLDAEGFSSVTLLVRARSTFDGGSDGGEDGGPTDGGRDAGLPDGGIDEDGDGYAAGPDCDDADPSVHPGQAETQCANGKDDDCNQLTDCADLDGCADKACDDQEACTTGDLCAKGTCRGAPVVCNSPMGCELDAGRCVAGTCEYPAAVGARCGSMDGGRCFSDKVCRVGEGNCANGLDDDQNGAADCLDPACGMQACDAGLACTVQATCNGTVCMGQAATCAVPMNGCFEPRGMCMEPTGCGRLVSFDAGTACPAGVCRRDGGCGPAETGALCTNGLDDDDDGVTDCADPSCAAAACNDRNLCTAVDRCTSGSCQGSGSTCALATACMQVAACTADSGACVYAPQPGAPCNDGGVCLLDGGCGDRFPFTVSNVDINALPRPDSGLTVGCATAEIQTGPDAPRWVPCSGAMGAPLLSVVRLPGSTEEAVVAQVTTLSIPGPGALVATGTRPIIVVVERDATINGTLTSGFIFPQGQNPLPSRYPAGASLPSWAGMGMPKSHCTTGTGLDGNGTDDFGSGASGGSFGTVGAQGGAANLSPVDVAGGLPSASNGFPELVPLRGGCSGGNGGKADGTSGGGGVGGGAIQVSVGGTLTVRGGRLGARGGGGLSGQTNRGGGGGGSGGGVLVEATQLKLENGALVQAHGGGGGEGAPSGVTRGEDGSASSVTPAAGASATTPGGNGGNGATLTAPATVGGNGVQDGTAGGGGGGGLGRIRFNVHGTCTLDGGTVSPPATGNCP